MIVNDYWRLALDQGCDFVHLGQEDLGRADLAAIRAAGMRLGISTHDEAELATALAAKPDYIALGPVFPTLLKKMPWAPQGLEKLGAWRQKIGDLPLVAIGGLTPARAVECMRAGADSAAVVTDITLNADPEGRTREWIEATRGFASAVTNAATRNPSRNPGAHPAHGVVVKHAVVIDGREHMGRRQSNQGISGELVKLGQRTENFLRLFEGRGDLGEAEVQSASTKQQCGNTDDRHKDHQDVESRVRNLRAYAYEGSDCFRKFGNRMDRASRIAARWKGRARPSQSRRVY